MIRLSEIRESKMIRLAAGYDRGDLTWTLSVGPLSNGAHFL